MRKMFTRAIVRAILVSGLLGLGACRDENAPATGPRKSAEAAVAGQAEGRDLDAWLAGVASEVLNVIP